MKKVTHFGLIVGLIFGLSSTVQAASYALTTGSCSTGDVTAEGISSVACLDYSGNQDGASYENSINTDFGLSDTINWDGVISSEAGQISTTESTWTYDGILSAPFVIILKASHAFTAYLFDAPDVANDGTYEVSITNKNGIAHDLSHMTIYTTTTGPEPGIDLYGSPVPLPAAVWLFGPALLGLMGFRRKLKS